nr:MAG TPA_asm: hypothetical protein [Caudoviricetes sp.]
MSNLYLLTQKLFTQKPTDKKQLFPRFRPIIITKEPL